MIPAPSAGPDNVADLKKGGVASKLVEDVRKEKNDIMERVNTFEKNQDTSRASPSSFKAKKIPQPKRPFEAVSSPVSIPVSGNIQMDIHDTVRPRKVQKFDTKMPAKVKAHVEEEIEVKDRFNCDQCDKSYGTKGSLRTHKYNHTKEEQLNHQPATTALSTVLPKQPPFVPQSVSKTVPVTRDILSIASAAAELDMLFPHLEETKEVKEGLPAKRSRGELELEEVVSREVETGIESGFSPKVAAAVSEAPVIIKCDQCGFTARRNIELKMHKRKSEMCRVQQ